MFAYCVLVYDVTRSLREKQTTLLYSTKLLVGFHSAVKRTTVITINEQYALGVKKSVDIGELTI